MRRLCWMSGLMLFSACRPDEKDSANAGTSMETACTEIGCTSGFTMVVTDAFGEPATGSYGSVAIVADEWAEIREYPFNCLTGEGDAFCDGNRVTILLEDAPEIPADAMYLFTVSVSDAESASETGTFRWSEVSPNGEGCPPTCYTMEVEVGLAIGEPGGG